MSFVTYSLSAPTFLAHWYYDGGIALGEIWQIPQNDSFILFSTSHVIPHIRALVPCPGLTSEASVVASTSVPLTPTEILNLVFL